MDYYGISTHTQALRAENHRFIFSCWAFVWVCSKFGINANFCWHVLVDDFIFRWSEKVWQPSKWSSDKEELRQWREKKWMLGMENINDRTILVYWTSQGYCVISFSLNIAIMAARKSAKFCVYEKKSLVDISIYMRSEKKNVQESNWIADISECRKFHRSYSTFNVDNHYAKQIFKWCACMQFKVIVIQCKSVDWECFSITIYSHE